MKTKFLGFIIIGFMVVCSIMLFIRCDIFIALSIMFLFFMQIGTFLRLGESDNKLDYIYLWIQAFDAEKQSKQTKKSENVVKNISNSIN